MKPAPQSPPAPSDDDASLPALWRAARHLAQWLISIAGAPGVIVAMRALAPKERAEMLSWLRPVEALLRRLLLIEAAGLINYLPAPEPRGTRAPRRRLGRFAEQDPLDPPSWRVAFRTLPPATRSKNADLPIFPKTVSNESASRPPSPTRLDPDLFDPWPIAERVEAVIRVFVNPEPYAKRLARRLLAKPKLAKRLTRKPRAAPRPGLGDWALGHASALAETAAGYFDTS